jgi:hypothetical protein
MIGLALSNSLYNESEHHYFWYFRKTFDSLRCLTALQPFVFGMRYLQCATMCALTKPCASLTCIRIAFILVAVLFIAQAIAALTYVCVTFPGQHIYHTPAGHEWLVNVYTPIYF